MARMIVVQTTTPRTDQLARGALASVVRVGGSGLRFGISVGPQLSSKARYGSLGKSFPSLSLSCTMVTGASI
jgi:hypothetical protein